MARALAPRRWQRRRPPAALPADVAAIVAENLADARALLDVCGLPPAVTESLLSSASDPETLGIDLDALLVAASDADPSTAPTLRRVVDSTAEYCVRLRQAATSEPSRPSRDAPKRRTAASGAAASGNSNGGGVRSLIGSFATYFGLVGGGDEEEDDEGPGARTTAGATRAAAADPIIALLRTATLPVLVPYITALARKPLTADGDGGGFGLALGELVPAAAAGVPVPPPPPADALVRQRVGLVAAEEASARAAVEAIQAQQAGWVVAQVLDVAALVEDADAPLVVPAAAASAAAPRVTPAPGDLLFSADGQSLAGRSFAQVVDALGAAPRQSEFMLLRVCQVPLLSVLAAIACGSGSVGALGSQ